MYACMSLRYMLLDLKSRRNYHVEGAFSILVSIVILVHIILASNFIVHSKFLQVWNYP